MKISWWRVAASTMMCLSLAGLGISITLDGDAMSWTIASLITYGLIRFEWAIATLGAITEDSDGEQEP